MKRFTENVENANLGFKMFRQPHFGQQKLFSQKKGSPGPNLEYWGNVWY